MIEATDLIAIFKWRFSRHDLFAQIDHWGTYTVQTQVLRRRRMQTLVTQNTCNLSVLPVHAKQSKMNRILTRFQAIISLRQVSSLSSITGHTRHFSSRFSPIRKRLSLRTERYLFICKINCLLTFGFQFQNSSTTQWELSLQSVCAKAFQICCYSHGVDWFRAAFNWLNKTTCSKAEEISRSFGSWRAFGKASGRIEYRWRVQHWVN